MRTSISAAALAVALATVLTGCATLSAGSSPSDSPAASTGTSGEAPSDQENSPIDTNPAAGWLDSGSAVGLITYGSGSCPPIVGDVTAEGQTVNVEFVVEENQVCTMDLRPRATYIPIPASVDRASDATLHITDGENVFDVAVPGAPDLTVSTAPSQKPAAARVGERDIVLLTWGSSSCTPEIETVDQTDPASTVITFIAPDGACTRDLAPRLTMFDGNGTADGATITLQGLDGATEPVTLTLEG